MRRVRKNPNIVCGVGINDHKYPAVVNKKHVKEYKLWKSMLTRCYDERFHARMPTYTGCEVSENFKHYSYFYEWCQRQIGFGLDGYQLDKDILVKGNKLYSEEICVFVPHEINYLFKDNTKINSDFGVGVSYHKPRKKFCVKICLGTNRSGKYVGLYKTAAQAKDVYRVLTEARGYLLAQRFKTLIDKRVYDVLVNL